MILGVKVWIFLTQQLAGVVTGSSVASRQAPRLMIIEMLRNLEVSANLPDLLCTCAKQL